MNENKEKVIKHFSKLVEHHGNDVASLDWGRKESQELRFKVLSEVGLKTCETVLDIGCGLAHLADYLESQGVTAQYTGYDITPAMVKQARQRRPDLDIMECDLLGGELVKYPTHDYVVSSGIFYLCKEKPLAFMDAMIRSMYARCRKGVAFNSLSSLADEKGESEFYADPSDVLRLCLEISPKAIVRHEYMAHDFTVFLYRNENEY